MRMVPLLLSLVAWGNPLFAQQQLLVDPPQVQEPFTLTALYDPVAGHNAFSYAGNAVPPVIRVAPGGSSYDVFILNDADDTRKIIARFGPYQSK